MEAERKYAAAERSLDTLQEKFDIQKTIKKRVMARVDYQIETNMAIALEKQEIENFLDDVDLQDVEVVGCFELQVRQPPAKKRRVP